MTLRQMIVLLSLLVSTVLVVSILALVAVEMAALRPQPTVVAPLAVTPLPTPAVMIGAGDITLCGQDGDDRTADLIERLIKKYPQATVFTVGDNVQVMGEMYEFQECFRPAWGRFQNRLRPSPGNHDWFTERGAHYFAYFGRAAGPPGLGYYSYDLGDWHIVSLNSNCGPGECDETSEQAKWLREDLAASSSRCTLLYWHHPLWDSGVVPIDLAGETFWKIASEYGAEIVVNGHDHHYERFAPLDAAGSIDYDNGIRPFIVGTGGAWLMELGQPLPATEARDNSTLGVIVFELYPDHYNWEFVPVDGGSYTDSGSGACR